LKIQQGTFRVVPFISEIFCSIFNNSAIQQFREYSDNVSNLFTNGILDIGQFFQRLEMQAVIYKINKIGTVGKNL